MDTNGTGRERPVSNPGVNSLATERDDIHESQAFTLPLTRLVSCYAADGEKSRFDPERIGVARDRRARRRFFRTAIAASPAPATPYSIPLKTEEGEKTATENGEGLNDLGIGVVSDKNAGKLPLLITRRQNSLETPRLRFCSTPEKIRKIIRPATEENEIDQARSKSNKPGNPAVRALEKYVALIAHNRQISTTRPTAVNAIVKRVDFQRRLSVVAEPYNRRSQIEESRSKISN